MNANNTTESSFFDYDTSFSESSLKELLEPIILPTGVSAEALAKIIAAIILRKSYFCSSTWSKWILLAALDELLGKPAPILNEKQLREVQGNQFEDSAVTSSGIGFESETEVSPPSMRSACVITCNCSNSTDATSPFPRNNNGSGGLTVRKKNKRKNINEGVSSANLDVKFRKQKEKIENCNISDEKTSKTLKKISLETNSSHLLPTLSNFKPQGDVMFEKDRQNSAVQTESICMINSATLTDHATLTDVASLTDHASMIDVASLTDHASKTDVASLTDHVSMTDVASLTDHVILIDCATSTDRVNFVDSATVTECDSLICLQCLRSLDQDQIAYDNPPKRFTENKSIQTDATYHLTKISGISSKSRNRKLCKNNGYIKNGELIIKAFYGKPLISQNSSLSAPQIPLEPVDYYYGLDPRIYSHEKQHTLSDLTEFAERRSSSISATSSPLMENRFTEDFNSSKETYISESSNIKRKRPRLDYRGLDASNNLF